ncbi:MAG TPA: FtsQ-type POTRA domain-containing protein [Nocardioides sp.]|nr:FtsQ-type POTRA domain-containing protein [Nocardioides sp.]
MADRSTQARARKRFARRQWARRWLTWRYVLAAVLVAGLVGFTVYSVYFSPWLRVEGAEVTGNSLLTEAEILDTADVPEGGALARVDLDAIAVRVRSLPAVKSVDVSRKWPHDVRIDVTEREPVAVVARGGGYVDLDEDGVTFGRFARPPAGLPRVETGPDAEPSALEEAAHVVAALPDEVSALVDHVQVDTVDQILLVLKDGRQVKWGSAEQSDEKAKVLLALLDRKAQVYDVSVPGMPTTH